MSDMTAQRAALDDARRFRAGHLMAVLEGLLEPLDVIDAAHEPTGTALRKIRLKDLILAPEKTPVRTWPLIRSRMLATLELEVPDRSLTIGWVIDPRAGGRRLYALKDALQPRSDVAWPGFPWAARPVVHGRGVAGPNL